MWFHMRLTFQYQKLSYCTLVRNNGIHVLDLRVGKCSIVVSSIQVDCFDAGSLQADRCLHTRASLSILMPCKWVLGWDRLISSRVACRECAASGLPRFLRASEQLETFINSWTPNTVLQTSEPRRLPFVPSDQGCRVCEIRERCHL